MTKAWRLLMILPNLLAGCSSADLVNSLVPTDDYRLVTDVAYGGNPRQKLDLYLPLAAGPHRVIVFFYGGNWQTGSKADYPFLGEAFASRGFIVVIPDYRLYPEVRYPGFLEDAASAVQWTLGHIGEYGGDPDKLSVMGHSAGAYIALMLVLDKDWLGPTRDRIKSAVGLAGPYNFLPLEDPTLQIIFATETDLTRTQPITYADGTAPPVLLEHGRLDNTVYPRNSRQLAARIEEHGGRVVLKTHLLLDHITLIGSLATPLRWLAPVRSEVVDFLDTH